MINARLIDRKGNLVQIIKVKDNILIIMLPSTDRNSIKKTRFKQDCNFKNIYIEEGV